MGADECKLPVHHGRLALLKVHINLVVLNMTGD